MKKRFNMLKITLENDSDDALHESKTSSAEVSEEKSSRMRKAGVVVVGAFIVIGLAWVGLGQEISECFVCTYLPCYQNMTVSHTKSPIYVPTKDLVNCEDNLQSCERKLWLQKGVELFGRCATGIKFTLDCYLSGSAFEKDVRERFGFWGKSLPKSSEREIIEEETFENLKRIYPDWEEIEISIKIKNKDDIITFGRKRGRSEK